MLAKTVLSSCLAAGQTRGPFIPPPTLPTNFPWDTKIESRRLATNPFSPLFPSYITRLLREWLSRLFPHMCVIPPKIESYRGLQNPCFPPPLFLSLLNRSFILKRKGKKGAFCCRTAFFVPHFTRLVWRAKKALFEKIFSTWKACKQKKLFSCHSTPSPGYFLAYSYIFFWGKSGGWCSEG